MSKAIYLNILLQFVCHISVVIYPKNYKIDNFVLFFSIVVFYNSLAHDRRELVHLKVSSANVQVTDDDNNIIPSQSNLIWTSATDSSQTEYEVGG